MQLDTGLFGMTGYSLWNCLSVAGRLSGRWLRDARSRIELSRLAMGSSLSARLTELRGCSALVATGDQLAAALALIELDGIARRLVLCPPDVTLDQLAFIATAAAIDTVVGELDGPAAGLVDIPRHVTCGEIHRDDSDRSPGCCTEWILLTSGTTGRPKMVSHTLVGLTGAIKPSRPDAEPVVWSTFYDIRRYGGLQILLRALLDGGSLMLSSAHETAGEFLTRAGNGGVTRISGTPSHWRRALMSQQVHGFTPSYVRLSGEIVDQAILDGLRAAYPQATIVHAYASTEAGVAFEVRDGLSGFPASLIGRQESGVEMKIEGGSLRIRSPRAASRYIGDSGDTLADAHGFIDTRDMVERRGERYYFAGRKDGIINVGGLKVNPEEIEAVINRHPDVRMSLVKARRSPITGAIVVADVVAGFSTAKGDDATAAALRRELLDSCRHALAPHKVPATIRFVESLDVTASGKLARR